MQQVSWPLPVDVVCVLNAGARVTRPLKEGITKPDDVPRIPPRLPFVRVSLTKETSPSGKKVVRLSVGEKRTNNLSVSP